MKRSKLKRRLRKKLNVGEFREFGFELFVKFKPDLSEENFRRLEAEFIFELERRSLGFGGGGDKNALRGFIAGAKRFTSPTVADRAEIKRWLVDRAEISECEIGNLADAWYDVN
jgi:uncharacterized protein